MACAAVECRTHLSSVGLSLLILLGGERVSGENLTRENKVGELVSPDLREVWRAEREIGREGRKEGWMLARLLGRAISSEM